MKESPPDITEQYHTELTQIQTTLSLVDPTYPLTSLQHTFSSHWAQDRYLGQIAGPNATAPLLPFPEAFAADRKHFLTLRQQFMSFSSSAPASLDRRAYHALFQQFRQLTQRVLSTALNVSLIEWGRAVHISPEVDQMLWTIIYDHGAALYAALSLGTPFPRGFDPTPEFESHLRQLVHDTHQWVFQTLAVPPSATLPQLGERPPSQSKVPHPPLPPLFGGIF